MFFFIINCSEKIACSIIIMCQELCENFPGAKVMYEFRIYFPFVITMAWYESQMEDIPLPKYRV